MAIDPTLQAMLDAEARSAAARHPLPRRRLSGLTLWLLLGLRVYVMLALPIVAYAFIKALRAGGH